MTVNTKIIDGRTMIPDLLRSAPETRVVLDQYGLRGCGGKLGPSETLTFFSNAHEVSLDKLLSEINSIIEQPVNNSFDESEDEYVESFADSIYRPFFLAGIGVILSVGSVWGAYLLIKIGYFGSFTAVGIHEVNAHGHAQIFGWVGLFVMGFAYQAFPRFKHTHLLHPQWAFATLWMMLIGILIRALLEPLGLLAPSVWNFIPLSSALEVVAIGLFIWIILSTLKQSGKPLAFYDRYIIASLVWFFIQAIYSGVLFWATAIAQNEEQLLHVISVWQAPLREIQIHGFATLMILGVSQRIFHNFYGFPKPSERKSKIAFVLLNIALIGNVVGFIFIQTRSSGWALLWYASILLTAGSIAYLLLDWKIYSKAADSDRSLKFLRIAYAWLMVSVGMTVLLPFYQFVALPYFVPDGAAASMGFSHAYYGAIRHAITVGFISMMIVGVAAKVVPTLNGINIKRLSSLWAPFVLINAGCFIRVVGQSLTDFSPAMFPIAGVSGLLEVTGLALWSFHIVAIILGRVRLYSENQGAQSEFLTLQPGTPIQAFHIVSDILEAYPNSLPVFLSHGFTPLQNPIMRKTVAKTVTLESACRMMGVDQKELVKELNQAVDQNVSTLDIPKPLYQIGVIRNN